MHVLQRSNDELKYELFDLFNTHDRSCYESCIVSATFPQENQIHLRSANSFQMRISAGMFSVMGASLLLQ